MESLFEVTYHVVINWDKEGGHSTTSLHLVLSWAKAAHIVNKKPKFVQKSNRLYFVIQFLQIETFESIAFSPVSPIEMSRNKSFFCHISQYGGLSLRCHRVTDLRKDLQM